MWRIRFFPSSFRVLLLTALVSVLAVASTHCVLAEAPDEDSPEHQALSLAKEALSDPAFTLREDYWRGIVSASAGRAVRLQFFKRNRYRLYFGVAPSELPKGARLHLHIFDRENTEVATIAGSENAAAVELPFENTLGTGLYLVLMRVEIPPGPFLDTEISAALFYGWN